VKRELAIRLAMLVALVAALAACGVQVPRAWEPLLEEVRAFEQRIGFQKTATFVEFSEEQGRVPFCGHVSPFYLPYSYEDPEIHWRSVKSERECRANADGADVYFGSVEVLGESGAAVSPEVLAARLQRFLYLVFHEDCHEQYDLPYGFEEALCNLIAYKAMEQFSQEKYGPKTREHLAIARYTSVEAKRTHTVKALYEQLAGHYARYERKDLSAEALMKERKFVFSKAERALAWRRGSLNNVGIANEMTYSRHYPLCERVYEALGRDLARTVTFFRRVDARKPTPAAVMKKHKIANNDGVEFIRAYEAEIVRIVEAACKDCRSKSDR
jgi:predicted small lipoprotein YifL